MPVSVPRLVMVPAAGVIIASTCLCDTFAILFPPKSDYAVTDAVRADLTISTSIRSPILDTRIPTFAFTFPSASEVVGLSLASHLTVYP